MSTMRTLLAAAALAVAFLPSAVPAQAGQGANPLLVPVGYTCTYVRYCARTKYCYDAYNRKYACGCAQWGTRCVKHYSSSSSSGGSGGSGY